MVSPIKCESKSAAMDDRTSTKLKGKEKAEEKAEENEVDEEATSTSDVEGEEVEADDAMEEHAVSAASKK